MNIATFHMASSRSSTVRPKKELAYKRLDALQKKLKEQYSNLALASSWFTLGIPEQENASKHIPASASLENDDHLAGVSGSSQSNVHSPSGKRRHVLAFKQ